MDFDLVVAVTVIVLIHGRYTGIFKNKTWKPVFSPGYTYFQLPEIPGISLSLLSVERTGPCLYVWKGFLNLDEALSSGPPPGPLDELCRSLGRRSDSWVVMDQNGLWSKGPSQPDVGAQYFSGKVGAFRAVIASPRLPVRIIRELSQGEAQASMFLNSSQEDACFHLRFRTAASGAGCKEHSRMEIPGKTIVRVPARQVGWLLLGKLGRAFFAQGHSGNLLEFKTQTVNPNLIASPSAPKCIQCCQHIITLTLGSTEQDSLVIFYFFFSECIFI